MDNNIDLEALKDLQPEQYTRNDIGTSDLFAAVYRKKLRYVPERKGFFVYDGKVWVKDADDLQAHELAKEFAALMIEYSRSLKENGDEALKYYAKYLSRNNRKRLLEDVRSINPIHVDQFDKQPCLFNCQNGTVDLVDGELRTHDPEDYLTKISNVWFDPDEKSGEFEKFIRAIMQDQQELVDYLQRALGYSLSNMSVQECFFITYGATTRNGKGTLNNTMLHMLGDYAKAAPYEVLESKKFRSSGGASEDVARLAGARYVSVSEPAEGITLDSALIKTLTGNDRITARYLYESSFEFIPSFKIWINTNHLPVIPDDTVFKSGRVQLIPFNRHFSEKEQDRSLKARLIQKENLSGAFNWCMEGFQLMVAEGGLTMPDVVRREVAQYREQNDRIGEFMTDCLVADLAGTHKEKLSQVYEIYGDWCKASGYKAWNKKNFKQKLSERVKVDVYAKQDQIFGYYIKADMPSEWRN